MARRLAAIMFTDLVGSTQLAQRDEKAALALLNEQERLARPILAMHRGRLVKSTGDGMLVEFANALDALECGIAFQQKVHERNTAEARTILQVRIGIHVGDVEGRGTDILGDAVNIAARVEPLADPGGVCISGPVYDQVRNKVAYRIDRMGPRTVKGVREPIQIFRVMLPWTSESSSQIPTPSVPRLAVLPFTNISPDPRDEYFADGLTEELISVISQIRGLRVISRTSVGQYKETTKPVAQIGAELGVSSILEGSVRKVGDQLRITVQLIDAATDEHRWAKTYDRKFDNVFAIQAEVAEQTAIALKVELLSSEIEAIQEEPTSNLAAYEAYLRGVQAFQNEALEGPETGQAAISFFETAIREDPGFSAAYSYLANYLLGILGHTRAAKDVVPRARELAAKALELNPNSADAHAALGNLALQGDQDWARAETEFREALRLNPSNSSAHFWFALLLAALQRLEESATHIRSATELDPLWIHPRLLEVYLASASGRHQDQISLAENLWKTYREGITGRSALAWAYALGGRPQDALRLVEPLRGASGFFERFRRSTVLAVLGEPEELRTLAGDWEAGRFAEYVASSGPAMAYAILGEREKAIALLERDARHGDRELWANYLSPCYDSIRDDPRFVAMLRAMSLPTTLPPQRSRLPGLAKR